MSLICRLVVAALIAAIAVASAGCAHGLAGTLGAGSVTARSEAEPRRTSPEEPPGRERVQGPVSAAPIPSGPWRLPKSVIPKVVPNTVVTPEVRLEIARETEMLERGLSIHVVPESQVLVGAGRAVPDVAGDSGRASISPPGRLPPALTYSPAVPSGGGAGSGPPWGSRTAQPLGREPRSPCPAGLDSNSSTGREPAGAVRGGASATMILSGARKPAPAAPQGGLVGSFDSLSYYDSFYIPPDPIGAAGPNHVVNVVNASFAFHDKSSGLVEDTDSLFAFFSALSPVRLFDPKVLYDQHAGRFVLVMLDASGSPLQSRILLAVSDDNDPNGTWYMTAINSLLVISGETRYADYPGLAVDEEAVYITANMFGVSSGGFTDARTWVVRKGAGSGGLYDGGPATVSLLDPPGNGSFNFTLQPAHLFGTHPSATVGTYFTTYNGISDGSNEYLRVLTLSNPLTAPSFAEEYVSVADLEDFSTGVPGATQPLPVPIPIEAGSRQVYHSVWRANRLYVVTLVVPPAGRPDANQPTAHWFQVNTALLGSPPYCQANPLGCVPDHGDVGGEDIGPGTATYYPSVAVAGSGTFAIGFAASGPEAFAGSYYAFRKSGDPAGTIGPSYLLRRGVNRYIRTFGSGRNRWGDYTGCAVDPLDDCFWVYNEHALLQQGAPANDNGVWGTAWGEVCPDQADCGNGIVEAGETCDATPGCRSSCNFCGDAAIDVAETCDPPGGACRPSCTFCGDAIVQGAEGEDCEDGNEIGGDGCDASCHLEICGNGVVQTGETCDPPGVPASAPDECRSNCTYCGDAVIEGSEQLMNGSFESGGFTSWVVTTAGTGAFGISTPGAMTPISSLPTAGNASGGAFYTVSDETGPGMHALSQIFTVPATAVQVVLSFEMFVNDWNGAGAIIDPIGLDHTGPPNQHARVDLLHAGFGPFDTSPAAVVANYYLGVDPAAPNPYTPYNIDITADVVPGGTYVIRFAETGNQSYLNMGVDNVRITTSPALEACDDGNNLDGDGCSSDCEAGCGTGTAVFSQRIRATSKTSFGWTSPVDVDYVRGSLALVSSYNVLATGSLAGTTSIPAPETPGPGQGFYWVVRVNCPTSTWSSGGSGEVPGRDTYFPTF